MARLRALPRDPAIELTGEQLLASPSANAAPANQAPAEVAATAADLYRTKATGVASAAAERAAADLDMWIVQAASGDRTAFRALVEATHRALYRFVRRALVSSSEADDVVQEVFARAWVALLRKGPPRAALPWLYGIARHIAIDTARARRTRDGGARWRGDDARLEHHSGLGDSVARDPRELYEAAEENSALLRAVQSLPPRHRTILLLREVDGLSYQELAAALDCKPGTVDSRLFRARAALAKRLAR